MLLFKKTEPTEENVRPNPQLAGVERLEEKYQERLQAWQSKRQAQAKIRDQDEAHVLRLHQQARAVELEAAGSTILPDAGGGTAVAEASATVQKLEEEAARLDLEETEARAARDEAQAAITAAVREALPVELSALEDLMIEYRMALGHVAQSAVEAHPKVDRLRRAVQVKEGLIRRLLPRLRDPDRRVNVAQGSEAAKFVKRLQSDWSPLERLGLKLARLLDHSGIHNEEVER